MQNRITAIVVCGVIVLCFSCNQYEPPLPQASTNLTIFHVNDQHGRMENFAKVKHIVEQEKQHSNVLLVCAGDIFSGNPVVDNYPDKGYPIIDIMNQAGFDVTVIGNHEFDYGEAALKDRMDQSQFPWICANVDMTNSVVDQPPAYVTLTAGDIRVTILGLVETNGAPGTIPSAHPGKMRNVSFQRPEDVVAQYSNLKEMEGADLYVALTHLGHDSFDPSVLGDFDLARQHPYFDLIIGGHTNQLLDTAINGIPVFMAGNNLNFLGKITLSIFNSQINHIAFELINLNAYTGVDMQIMSAIQSYNASIPGLDEVIGFSVIHHVRGYNVGCFYTDAMRTQLGVDWTCQNGGGVRDDLDAGDITRREVYAIDPFNNGTLTYTMTVGEVKGLLRTIDMGLYYSGIIIENQNGELFIRDQDGNLLDNNITLTLGINDFIPAVRPSAFPLSADTLPVTTAEVVIKYLENTDLPVNYPECTRYFRY